MSDIEKLSIYDSRVVQQRPKFAVDKGALSLTNSPFNSIAATSSQMTFNITAPSLSVYLDRELEWTTSVDCQMRVNVANAPGTYNAAQLAEPVFAFGKDGALAAFPLHSLASTMTATINDCVSTINTQDVLYEVLRLTDIRRNKLRKTTPSMLDKYANYNDAVGAINNPLASYADATYYDNVPNGAFYNIQFMDANGAVLTGTGTYNDGSNTVRYENGVPVLTNGVADAAITQYQIFFRFTATEKLVLSPFIFNEECGDSVGLFGINNIQLVFNFGQGIQRVVRNAPLANGGTGGLNRSVSNVAYASTAPFKNARVNCLFLTPPLDISLPPKSVVPYLEYPRYISTPNQTIAAGATQRLTSQTLSLPQIPDALVIYVKPPQYADNTQGDYYLPIKSISVNFDNYAGLLSSHTTEQLYAISVDNGLVMDWNAWSGKGRSVSSGGNIQLVGGFLVLKMGKDITLQAGQAPSVVNYWRLGK